MGQDPRDRWGPLPGGRSSRERGQPAPAVAHRGACWDQLPAGRGHGQPGIDGLQFRRGRVLGLPWCLEAWHREALPGVRPSQFALTAGPPADAVRPHVGPAPALPALEPAGHRRADSDPLRRRRQGDLEGPGAFGGPGPAGEEPRRRLMVFPRWAFDPSRFGGLSDSLGTTTRKRSLGALFGSRSGDVRGLGFNVGGYRRSALAGCAAVLASAGLVLAMGASAEVALAKAPTGACAIPGKTMENVFTRVTPLSGSTVHPGDLVGADYHDESELYMTPPYQLLFTLTGPDGTSTLSPTITSMPAHTGGTTGEYKIVKRISATLPSNPSPGSYTATIRGFDSDHTKPGADCGTASWTFQVQPVAHGSLSGDILLCASGARVNGGTIATSGPQSRSATANPVSYQIGRAPV